MKSDLILSVFPGIGLLDRAFESVGFCVVRGPDKLWGGDIKTFHPPAHRFDGIIGGPPCQCFSQLSYLVKANGFELAENLIPEFERCVEEGQPRWFLMENAKKSPEPTIHGYGISSVVLNNRWFGAEQNRERRFSFGVQGDKAVNISRFIEFSVFENFDKSPAVCASGGTKPGIATSDRKTRAKYMGWKTADALKESIRLQGLPDNFLSDAPFTLEGKHKVVGNGVPLPLGKAVASAIKTYIEQGNV